MHRTLEKKLIYMPKAGTPRAKWLKENFKASTRFTEKK